MNHEHDHKNVCPYCPPANSQPLLSKSAKDKLLSFFGVCGSLSCYFAMFPAVLLGIVGVLGLSQSSTASALNAYMVSALFQPILIVSIIFLAAGTIRYGKLPLWLSIIGGIGIFASMNFYMREWLFTLSFSFVAFAYFFAFRQTKTPQLKFAFFLLTAVVIFGVFDVGRSVVKKNLALPQALPQTQPANNMMNMNGRR